MPNVPRIGWVRIYTVDPPLSIIARLGEDRPTVEQGYGGWEEVARPRRSPITTFKGPPALHLTVPILLDGWAADRSVEPDVAALERMGRPTAADGEPPRVKLSALGAALPGQARRWLIDTIEWGDALMNPDGNRVRQAAVLRLIEFVEDVHLAERSAANRRRAAAAKKKKQGRGAAKKRITATAKAKAKKKTRSAAPADWGEGEDLLTIAARELGDANRWVEIAQLNGLRDPRAIRPGQVLRMP